MVPSDGWAGDGGRGAASGTGTGRHAGGRGGWRSGAVRIYVVAA